MNRNSKRLCASLVIMLLFAAVACVLRTLACLWHLEENQIYFAEGGMLSVAGALVVVGAILSAAIALTMDKEPVRAHFSSALTFVPTGLTAVALLIFGLCMLAVYTTLDSPLPDQRVSIASALALACAVLAPLSAVHFFLNAFLTERHTLLRAGFSLATVLLGALYAAFLYFGAGLPINAPNKLVEQMAYLFCSLFFLYETRISLGREMWRGYSVFGLIAAMLTAYASLPALIAYFIDGVYVTKTVESAALLFAFFIFITSRLCMAVSAAPDGECPEMAALRAFAERREEELRSGGRIEDGVQISITELIDIPKHSPAEDDEGDAEPEAKAEPEAGVDEPRAEEMIDIGAVDA